MAGCCGGGTKSVFAPEPPKVVMVEQVPEAPIPPPTSTNMPKTKVYLRSKAMARKKSKGQ